MAKLKAVYTKAFVDKLRDELTNTKGELALSNRSWERERTEVHRLEALVDNRWDEMQRLRDLIYAISTGKNPRNVVEREVEALRSMTMGKTVSEADEERARRGR